MLQGMDSASEDFCAKPENRNIERVKEIENRKAALGMWHKGNHSRKGMTKMPPITQAIEIRST